MEFLTPGEKIKRMRKMLGIKQDELAGDKFARNFISMLESGRRNLTLETATTLAKEFNRIAWAKGLTINVTAEYLMASKEEDAHNYYYNIVMESSEIMAIEEVIKYSTDYNFIDILIIAYEKLGNIYYEQTEYSKARTNYFEVLELAHQIGDKNKLSYLYNKVGKCKLQLLDYNEAITFFNKGYAYAIECNHDENKKNILFNLALCNKRLGNYDDAIYLISEYMSLNNQESERDTYLNAMLLKINCYIETEEYVKSLYLYDNLLNTLKDSEIELKSYIYNNMGLAYFYLENFETSLSYFDMALKLRKDCNVQGMAHTMIDKSRVYVKQEKYQEALASLNEALEIAKSLNDNVYLLRAYTLLEDIYIAINDMDSLEKVYMNAIDIEKNTSIKTGLQLLYSKLAKLYVTNGNPTKCSEYLDKLINLNK